MVDIGRASKAEEKVSTANPRSTLGTLAEHILHTDRYILEHIWLYSLLLRDMVVEHCYRQFGRQTINPSQKLTSMNSLQLSCMITWA